MREGLRILFFPFFPSFFWCGTLTIKHGEGVLTMVLWGECASIDRKEREDTLR